MGRTIIVGMGLLARAVAHSLAQHGHHAVTVGRRDGVDIRGRIDLTPFTDGEPVDAVIEATGTDATRSAEAVRFFEASARHVAAAAQEVGAGMHLLVSIVGCERAAGFAHYAGKAAQERAVRAAATEGTPAIVVRSTQWFAFPRQLVDRLARGPVMLVPRMLVRPVALDAVAEAVAEIVVGKRERESACLCGPEDMTLAQMVAALDGRPAVRIPVQLPGAARAARTGALLPTGGVEVVGPRYADWLRTYPDGRRHDLVG